MEEENPLPAPNPATPPRFHALGWIAIFIAVGAVIFLAWSQFQRAMAVSREMLPEVAVVPPFSFLDQEGRTVTNRDLAEQIWVSNFIFTRCTGPCPLMTSRMMELQLALQKRGVEGVQLVSVTVDPEYDQPEVLAQYAESVRANPARWRFLTGPKDDVEKFVTRGMLQPLAEEPDGMPAHSTRFVVVDGRGRIRSFQDGQDPEVVNKLLLDLGALLREPFHRGNSESPGE
jgi:protein SCO1/2